MVEDPKQTFGGESYLILQTKTAVKVYRVKKDAAVENETLTELASFNATENRATIFFIEGKNI